MNAKVKYYWHLLNYTHSKTIIQGCLDSELRAELEKKIRHHEKSALSHMLKF